MTITITPDTELFTLAGDAAGYTLLDGILGDMSATRFMEDYEGDDAEAQKLIEWLSPLVKSGEGYWDNEAEAQEESENHRYVEVTKFSVAGVLREIKEAAESEKKYRDED